MTRLNTTVLETVLLSCIGFGAGVYAARRQMVRANKTFEMIDNGTEPEDDSVCGRCGQPYPDEGDYEALQSWVLISYGNGKPADLVCSQAHAEELINYGRGRI